VVGALTEVGRDMGWQWKVKLLTFVRDTCGSVRKEHLEKKLEELQVLKSKWKGIRERLVRRSPTGGARQGFQVLLCSEVGRTKRAGRRQDRCT
jgi:hypothetical protein